MSSAESGAKRKPPRRYSSPRSRPSEALLITLVADVAQSYFTLRELDLELEIARRTVEVNDATVRFYQTRLTGGVSNRLELDTGHL